MSVSNRGMSVKARLSFAVGAVTSRLQCYFFISMKGKAKTVKPDGNIHLVDARFKNVNSTAKDLFATLAYTWGPIGRNNNEFRS